MRFGSSSKRELGLGRRRSSERRRRRVGFGAGAAVGSGRRLRASAAGARPRPVAAAMRARRGARDGRQRELRRRLVTRRGPTMPIATCMAAVRSFVTSDPHWAMARYAAVVRSWQSAKSRWVPADLAHRRARRELARPLHRPRDGVGVVVGQHARRLEEHLGVEAPLAAAGPPRRRCRPRSRPAGDPWSRARRDLSPSLRRACAERGQLRLPDPGHRTTARTTATAGPRKTAADGASATRGSRRPRASRAGQRPRRTRAPRRECARGWAGGASFASKPRLDRPARPGRRRGRARRREPASRARPRRRMPRPAGERLPPAALDAHVRARRRRRRPCAGSSRACPAAPPASPAGPARSKARARPGAPAPVPTSTTRARGAGAQRGRARRRASGPRAPRRERAAVRSMRAFHSSRRSSHVPMRASAHSPDRAAAPRALETPARRAAASLATIGRQWYLSSGLAASPAAWSAPPARPQPVHELDLGPLAALVARAFPGDAVASPLDCTPMPGGASTRRYFRVPQRRARPRSACSCPTARRPRRSRRAARRRALALPRGARSARGARRRRARGLRRGHRARAGSCSRTSATTRSPPSSRAHPDAGEALYVRAVDRPRPRPGAASRTLPEGCVVALARLRRGPAPLGDRPLPRVGPRGARRHPRRGRPRRPSTPSRSGSRARIAGWPRGFVHRDYQSRNLMVRPGEVALLDRLPGRAARAARLRPRRAPQRQLPDVRPRLRRGAPRRLRPRARASTPPSGAELGREFDLVTVQRKLKDAGRFVFIDRVKNNPSFLQFVEPTIAKVRASLDAPRRTTRTCASSRRSWRARSPVTMAAPPPPHDDTPRRTRARAAPRAPLHPHGLDLGDGEVLPLWAGAMHYWRHPRERVARRGSRRCARWACASSTPTCRGACTRRRPASSTSASATRASTSRASSASRTSVGLRCVLRPGPHINAELTFFGLPERVVWDPECQARTPGGQPGDARRWCRSRSRCRATRATRSTTRPRAGSAPSASSSRACAGPTGPIVLVQVDNEGALYFRDGAYDQDYHPDAIARLPRLPPREVRAHAARASRRLGRRRASTFATVEPPRRFDAQRRGRPRAPPRLDGVPRAPALDARWSAWPRRSSTPGFDGLPTTHNLPLGESATPLNPARMTAIDLVGLDYYHRATPAEHWTILRRTTELACRCEGRQTPAFGAEVGAGFPPFFAPLDEHDSLYALIARARVRPARLQPVHGGRARPLDRRAHRSARQGRARSPPTTRRLLDGARPDVASTRCAGARRCASSCRARSGASPARRTRSARSRRRSSTSSARAGARASRARLRARRARPSSPPRRTCARSSGRSTRAACPSPTPAARRVEHSTAGARWIVCASAGGPEAAPRRQPARGAQGRRAGHDRPARARARRRDAPAASTRVDVDGLRDRAARRPRPRRRARRAPHRRARRCRRGRSTRSTRTSRCTRTPTGTPRVVFVMNPTRGRPRRRASRSGASRRSSTCSARAGWSVREAPSRCACPRGACA